MKELWNKLKKWFIEEEWLAFLALLVVLIIIYFLIRKTANDTFPDELVEYVGLILDVLFFGTIMGFYQARMRKRKQTREYCEQLRDYWYWEDREGILRKTGILRRLGALSKACPHMSGISLNGADLRRFDFSYCTVDVAKFSHSQISETKFIKSVVRNAYFQFAEAWGADFQGATLDHTTFEGAKLYEVNFTDAKLKWVDFTNARVDRADFSGADTYDTDFRHTDLGGTKGLTQEQINVAQTSGAILPKGLVHGPQQSL